MQKVTVKLWACCTRFSWGNKPPSFGNLLLRLWHGCSEPHIVYIHYASRTLSNYDRRRYVHCLIVVPWFTCRASLSVRYKKNELWKHSETKRAGQPKQEARHAARLVLHTLLSNYHSPVVAEQPCIPLHITHYSLCAQDVYLSRFFKIPLALCIVCNASWRRMVNWNPVSYFTRECTNLILDLSKP
jgi:hypothetical protein